MISKLIKKHKKLAVYFLILGFVFFGAFRLSESRSASFHFVDEEDHITFAHYINKEYKLHRDLQGNHQPLVYFGSALLQKVTKPANIFMLVKRHRQAMFFYGLFWSLLFVTKFGLTGLIFSVLFEFLKYWQFGNLFLQESFAAYPIFYLFMSLMEMLLWEKKPKKLESIFLGLCTFIVIFSLIPFWPWLILLWLIFLMKNRKFFLYQFLTTLILTIVLFLFYSPIDWFRETIYNNVVYAIPVLSEISGIQGWLKLIFFPFLSFTTKDSLQANFISLFITGWLVGIVYLLKKKDKKIIWLGIAYVFLFLANTRVLSPGAVFYEGFHLLPWLGLMWIVFIYSLRIIGEGKKFKKIAFPLFFIWGAFLLTNKSMPYFWKTDIDREYYVNYSVFDDFNFAIKTIAKPGDRLAVFTNESLIHWNTETVPATRQIVYYAWEPLMERLRREYEEGIIKNSPEFIYGGKEQELVKEKYVNILRNDKATGLFVRKDKYEKITEDEWKVLTTREFEKYVDKYKN